LKAPAQAIPAENGANFYQAPIDNLTLHSIL